MNSYRGASPLKEQIMKTYLTLATEKYLSRKENISRNRGTIAGMADKAKIYKEHLTGLDHDLENLEGQFLSEKDLSDNQKRQVKNINSCLIADFRDELYE